MALAIVLVCPIVAWACTFGGPPTDWVALGFVGVATVADELPANAATVDLNPDLVDFSSDFRPVEGLQLWRFRDDVTAIPIGDIDVPLSDIPDTTPPERPTITDAYLEVSRASGDCNAGDCDVTVARTHIEVTPGDDETAAPDRLTYLVYVRRSSTMGGPSIQAVTFPDDSLGGSLWLWADESDEGRELWAWVRTLDQAGNVSELSEPFPIDTGHGGGCALTGGSGRGGLLLPVLFALLLVRRRAGR